MVIISIYDHQRITVPYRRRPAIIILRRVDDITLYEVFGRTNVEKLCIRFELQCTKIYVNIFEIILLRLRSATRKPASMTNFIVHTRFPYNTISR